MRSSNREGSFLATAAISIIEVAAEPGLCDAMFGSLHSRLEEMYGTADEYFKDVLNEQFEERFGEPVSKPVAEKAPPVKEVWSMVTMPCGQEKNGKKRQLRCWAARHAKECRICKGVPYKIRDIVEES